MSGFVPTKTHEFEFECDTVVVEMKPLENKDMGRLMVFAEESGEDNEGNPKYRIDPQRIGEFAEAVGKLLPEYVTSFTGLKDANGNAVPLEDACRYRYFIDLMMDIGSTLMASGDLKEDEGKNSEGPLGDSSRA